MRGWQNSNRRSRLPANWQQIRTEVFRRDGGRCMIRQADGTRCPNAATAVDHILAGDDHSWSNLQAICDSCHATKSGREGAAASHAKKARIKNRFRRDEPHPNELYFKPPVG